MLIIYDYTHITRILSIKKKQSRIAVWDRDCFTRIDISVILPALQYIRLVPANSASRRRLPSAKRRQQ